MKSIYLTLTVFTLYSVSAPADQMNYQGFLTDLQGAPLADGQYNITFNIYSQPEGGTVVWGPYILDNGTAAGHGPKVSLAGGRFSTVIGPQDVDGDLLSDSLNGNNRYLEIVVGSNAPISPRQQILAAPKAMYADRAGHATSATAVGNPSGISAINIDGVAVDMPGTLNVQGNITADRVIPELLIAKDATITGKLRAIGSERTFEFFPGLSESSIDGTLTAALTANVGPQMRFQANSEAFFADLGLSGNNNKFVVETNDATRFAIDQNGRVGIGTGTSELSSAKLEVNGGTHVASMTGAYLYTSGAFPAVGHGAKQVSIKTSDTIWCGAYVIASSDERIKSRSRRSNSAEDLQTLLQLEVTDYQFKDTIAHGSTPQKKLIAQQVKEVYPQAVSLHTNVIPDIYQQAQIENGWIHLATELKPGERVRLIGESEEGIYEVIEAKPDQFRIDFKSDGDRVFVYGREVEDFHTLDYDAIAMLNVSATQELKKEMDAKVRTLSEENETLKAKLANLERSMGALTRLVENLSPTSVPVLAER